MTEHRVVVAEDEPRILRNIVEKIEGSHSSFRVVATAQDGEEALALVRKHRPALLFTDIRMPKRDGLSLIEEALARQPELRVVIVSGHDHFPYARKALSLGAVDYLLKPLDREEVRALLEKLAPSLDEQARRASLGSLESWLFRGKGRRSDRGYVLFLGVFGHLICPPERPEQAVLSQLEERAGRIIEEVRAISDRWEAVPTEQANRLFFLLRGGGEERPPLQAKLLREHLEGVLGGCPLTLLYGETPLSEEQLYETGRLLIRKAEGALVPGCSNTLPLGEAGPILSGFHPDQEERIRLYCRKGERSRLREYLLSLFPAERNLTQADLLARFERSALLAEGILGAGEASGAARLLSRLRREFSSQRPLEEIFALYCQGMEAFFSRTVQIGSPGALADRLEAYLREHYPEDLSFEEISGRFGYEGAYLARIYKKYKGESPVRALGRIRIERACELIRSREDLDLKEVAALTGYGDHHYFSRVFKKAMGKSPSAWRRELQA